MQLSLTIDSLRHDVSALAALGDEGVEKAGQRIAAALGPAATCRLIELLGQAALEVSDQLPNGRAELRVAGDDASLVVILGDEPAEVPEDSDMSARITLRLPGQLKARIEEVAKREGSSTNTWILRSLTRAAMPLPQSPAGRPGHRLWGFGQS